MAPLTWVEGKPVYKGDVLYNKNSHIPRIVAGVTDDGRGIEFESSGVIADISILTWTPPKKTRKVKLLGWLTRDGLLIQVTENYVRGAGWTRVPSEDRTVTVEE